MTKTAVLATYCALTPFAACGGDAEDGPSAKLANWWNFAVAQLSCQVAAMRFLPLAPLALWIASCSSPSTRAPAASIPQTPEPALRLAVAPNPPAPPDKSDNNEPAATSPLLPPKEAPAEPKLPTSEREALANADACPRPVDTNDTDFAEYDAFVDKALGFPQHDEVVVVKVSPSFAPIRTLALVRDKNGAHLLRTKRLNKDVWAEMLTEMRAQQGPTIHLYGASQKQALERLSAEAEVRELPIDAKTAQLTVTLWRSLIARAEVVQEVGVLTGKLDGTVYEIWHRGTRVSTHSPEHGTVLGKAVSGIEHLAHAVELGPGNERDELMIARTYMEDALERTRRKEPCLRPYRM